MIESAIGVDAAQVAALASVVERIQESAVWTIRKYHSSAAYNAAKKSGRAIEPDEILIVKGNLLLNEGINAMWNLICGETETDFSESNAYIGVGDDNTAAAATQTGLQAVTNKLYVAVEAGYPTCGSDQKATWQAEFGSSEGNFDWEEITVASGNSDSADNMNRKVQSMGTKASGSTWTVSLEITLS